MKTIDMLINEIKASEALQKLLADAVRSNALDAFLREQGADATAEEFIAALREQAEQMDESALDTIAGGANSEEALLSIFSLGIACAIEAINSSKRKDEDWGDGRILCDAS